MAMSQEFDSNDMLTSCDATVIFLIYVMTNLEQSGLTQLLWLEMTHFSFFQNYWIAIKILNPLTYFIGNQKKKKKMVWSWGKIWAKLCPL